VAVGAGQIIAGAMVLAQNVQVVVGAALGAIARLSRCQRQCARPETEQHRTESLHRVLPPGELAPESTDVRACVCHVAVMKCKELFPIRMPGADSQTLDF
jgi:hypothetical protein